MPDADVAILQDVDVDLQGVALELRVRNGRVRKPIPPLPLEKNDESKFAKRDDFSRIGKKVSETECHGLQPATTTVSASDSCPTAVI